MSDGGADAFSVRELARSLAHPEFVSGFERSTTARANHRSTIPTGQRLIYFGCAFRTVKLGLRALFVFLVVRLRHSNAI